MNRITCEEAFRQLDDYLDRQLGVEESRRIDEHLAICDACLQEFTFERSVIEGVREKIRRIDAPPGLLGDISFDIARAARKKLPPEEPA